ncbi:UNVERIFIED_CONTAM: hypothetical protein FKN15_046700 [Acipenser sinensis]
MRQTASTDLTLIYRYSWCRQGDDSQCWLSAEGDLDLDSLFCTGGDREWERDLEREWDRDLEREGERGAARGRGFLSGLWLSERDLVRLCFLLRLLLGDLERLLDRERLRDLV